MPHGKPDWGVDWTPRTVRGLEDLGEHAVRLGSPHLWDRRGDTIWLTDFRNGMGDTLGVALPVEGTVSLWAGNARQGAFCVRLMANAAQRVSLQKYLPYPVASRIGLEFSFSIDFFTNYVCARIYADNLVNEYQGFVRYDVVNDRLEYMQEPVGPTWVPFAWNLNLPTTDISPNVIKIVVDIAATPPVFVLAIINDVSYPLAAVPLWGAVSAGIARTYFVAMHTATAGGDAEISVDNMIVTQNEP